MTTGDDTSSRSQLLPDDGFDDDDLDEFMEEAILRQEFDRVVEDLSMLTNRCRLGLLMRSNSEMMWRRSLCVVQQRRHWEDVWESWKLGGKSDELGDSSNICPG